MNSITVNQIESIKFANPLDLKFTSGMKKELTDEQLILKYAKGNAEAFDVLYQRHRAGLFRYCLRQFSSRAVAEECFQDVWMKVINNRSRYQPKALFTTYLYRIATNHVIDIYRKEKKRLSDCEYQDEQVINESSMTEGLHKENMESQERAVQLRKMIEKLPLEQKNTLLLKLNTGLSLEDIAVVLDCGKETVKSRLRYATYKLRELLQTPLGETKNEA
jgi:RNA polymerase sigma-70 factor (ECF subfamily)